MIPIEEYKAIANALEAWSDDPLAEDAAMNNRRSRQCGPRAVGVPKSTGTVLSGISGTGESHE